MKFPLIIFCLLLSCENKFSFNNLLKSEKNDLSIKNKNNESEIRKLIFDFYSQENKNADTSSFQKIENKIKFKLIDLD